MFSWIFLSGTATGLIGYMAIAAVAAHRMTRPHRRRPQRTPEEVGLPYEPVIFTARGEALNLAAWYIPAPEAHGAVVIAHGIGGCRGREFTASSLPLAQHMVRSGLSVLMIDLRGHGESGAARMTYGARERRDVLGAVDWLLARGYSAGRIGILGASMGGVAAIGAARVEPAIRALIIDSSCASFPDMMRTHFRAWSKLPAVFLPGALLIAWLLTGENLGRLRPSVRLRTMERRPMMVIHARGDQLVPTDHAHANASAAGAELWITDSARHLGSFALLPHTYSNVVTQFFQLAFDGETTVENDQYAALQPDNTLSLSERMVIEKL